MATRGEDAIFSQIIGLDVYDACRRRQGQAREYRDQAAVKRPPLQPGYELSGRAELLLQQDGLKEEKRA